MGEPILIIWIVVVALAGLMVLLYMYWEAHREIVLEKRFVFPDLPSAFEGFTFFFISDIHRRRVSQELLSRIGRPEVIVIGGDLTEHGVPFSRVDENLEKLGRFGVPILFVWGNHDLYVDRARLLELFNKHRVVVLENDAYILRRDRSVLNFIGVGDTSNNMDRLEDALARVAPGFRLLISHNPEIGVKIRPDDDISLVVSGHTHGGQIRLFGWGPREAGGVKRRPFGTLVISNGYGTTRFPLRLGAPPDTLLIRLYREEKSLANEE
jgi:predicted MPP superfamily phosphohydrolase